MKSLSYLLVASCLFLSPAAARAAQTAQARLYSLSIKINQASNIYGDLMKLSTTGAADNGLWELAPSQPLDAEITLPGQIGYGGGFWFWDNTYDYWNNYGNLNLNLPDFTDLNNNRFPDFFEVSRGLSAATSVGSYNYQDPTDGMYYPGNIYATWNRTAGSKTGTLQLALSDPYWGTFNTTFEIQEYKGTLTYTPGATTVTGTLTVTQTGSNNTFTGSVQFLKSDTNRFDSLILQPGILTDASAMPNNFTNRYFFRDVNWPTNYAGYVQFDNDGDVGTFYPYAVWVLSIDDTNDANKNGIPDFSDDVVVAPPNPPHLALGPTSTNFLLSVSGDVGRVHKIQQSATLAPGSWTDVTSLTLTNPTVVVPLTPSGAVTFWRVQAQ